MSSWPAPRKLCFGRAGTRLHHHAAGPHIAKTLPQGVPLSLRSHIVLHTHLGSYRTIMQDDNVWTLSMSARRMAPPLSPQNRPNNNKTATQQLRVQRGVTWSSLLWHALKM